MMPDRLIRLSIDCRSHGNSDDPPERTLALAGRRLAAFRSQFHDVALDRIPRRADFRRIRAFGDAKGLTCGLSIAEWGAGWAEETSVNCSVSASCLEWPVPALRWHFPLQVGPILQPIKGWRWAL